MGEFHPIGSARPRRQVRPTSAQVAMPAADTEYSWAIPAGVKSFTLLLGDAAVAWRFSATAGQVAAVGGGTPRPAGTSAVFNSSPPHNYTGTVYFAHSNGAAQTMRIEYEADV